MGSSGSDFQIQGRIEVIRDTAAIQAVAADVEALGAKARQTASSGILPLATSTDTLSSSQRVSSRELKVLTRELLVSAGAAEGAGAAGRVVATAFTALGDAAELANLALASTGLLAVLLLPKLLEWAGDSKKVAEENMHVREQVAGVDDQLQQLIKDVPTLNPLLRAWADSVHQVALDQQQLHLDELHKKMERLKKDGDDAADSAYSLGTTWAALLMSREELEAKKQKLRETWKMDQNAMLALKKEIEATEEAQKRRITLSQLEEKEHDRGRQKIKDLRISQEAYTKAVKEWDFAEKSAAVRRENQKKQETDLLALEKARFKLQQEEAHRLREQAEKDADKADDDQRRDDERHQQKRDNQRETAQLAARTLTDLFHKNKAAAIAQAIVDTYAAAAAAYKRVGGGPWGIPVVVMTIAEGLAQVAMISKTGFDDPQNDMLARNIGHKWAEDALRHIDTGFWQQLEARSMGAGSVTHRTTIDRGVHVGEYHSHSIVGAERTQQLVRLKRMLDGPIDRRERRTTIGG